MVRDDDEFSLPHRGEVVSGAGFEAASAGVK
jgi:hypothetical protein